MSWTTKQPGGFSDEQLAWLRKIIAPFARLGEIFALRRTAATLLDTYVGNSAGERILAGQIRRGHAEAMQAAIWLSDLRGFTALSDRLPAETVVDILNQYFDCQVGSIRSHGGEVLKYMGDGLLAVFPIDEYVGDARQVCSRVLEAARESRAGVPLWRVGAFVQTPHPDVFGRSFIWRQGADIAVSAADFDLPDSPQFIQSPLALLYSSRQEVRFRLDDPESKRFPFFDDMRAEGVTD